MAKKTLTKAERTNEEPAEEVTSLVRVEESVEDFIKSNLPRVAGTKLSIMTIFNRNGAQYYRCNFWGEGLKGAVIRDSRFVRVERVNGSNVLVDLTSRR